MQDDLEIHGGFIGLAEADAIDAVLADEDEGVGEKIRCHGEFAAGAAHLKFVTLELFLIHVFLSILEG